jgi:hypothetical protein
MSPPKGEKVAKNVKSQLYDHVEALNMEPLREIR